MAGRLTRIRDLSDHCVKGETDKVANYDPIGIGFSIKYLRGYDLGERPRAHREGELKNLSEDKERLEETLLRR